MESCGPLLDCRWNKISQEVESKQWRVFNHVDPWWRRWYAATTARSPPGDSPLKWQRLQQAADSRTVHELNTSWRSRAGCVQSGQQKSRGQGQVAFRVVSKKSEVGTQQSNRNHVLRLSRAESDAWALTEGQTGFYIGRQRQELLGD